jgi:hypothetical protein
MCYFVYNTYTIAEESIAAAVNILPQVNVALIERLWYAQPTMDT